MNCKEFGAGGRESVMLIHGGGLSWWNYREAALILAHDHRVILPILDGHAGSDCPFTTIESNAEEIIAWIDGHLDGHVSLIGGLSLGGQVLLEMLSRRKDICRSALVESAMAVPAAMTDALIGPTLALSYGLIRNERFARLQFRSLRMKPELFGDYYRDTCLIGRRDMIAFMKASAAYALKDAVAGCTARVRVFAGKKEVRGILKSAELIRSRIPGSTLTVLPGLYHGEFSINHADDYARTVRELVDS